MTDKTELPVPLLLDGHTALLGQAVQPGPHDAVGADRVRSRGRP